MTALILSIASLVIAVLSYLGAKRAERITGLRNELSCLPAVMPETRTNVRGGSVGLLIENRGTGIAVIDKILITHPPSIVVNVTQNPDWLGELKTKLSGAAISTNEVHEIKAVAPVKNVYTASATAGTALNVGTELWLLQGDPGNLSSGQMQTVIEWTKNLEVQVDYSSVYRRRFSTAKPYDEYINGVHESYRPALLRLWSGTRSRFMSTVQS